MKVCVTGHSPPFDRSTQKGKKWQILLLKELALTSDQFLDMGILAGFYNSPSLPIVDWSLKAVLALLERYKSAPTALLAISQDPSYPNNIQQSGYFESYARAKTLIKFSLVLAAEEGRILPLPIAIPPDRKSVV